MSKSEIITAFVAIYGAVLSTIAIIKQLRSDRIKVKLSVDRNMRIYGDIRYEGKTLTVVRVTNQGRRPVTITTFGTVGLYPHSNLFIYDSQPQLPHEINDGQFIISRLPQDDIRFEEIDYWAAWDSYGRIHKLRAASRFKHWKSRFQLKRSFRKKKA